MRKWIAIAAVKATCKEHRTLLEHSSRFQKRGFFSS